MRVPLITNGPPVTVISDAATGQFTVQLEPGNYGVQVMVNPVTAFDIAVPAGAGHAYNIGDLVTSAVVPLPGFAFGSVPIAGTTDPQRGGRGCAGNDLREYGGEFLLGETHRHRRVGLAKIRTTMNKPIFTMKTTDYFTGANRGNRELECLLSPLPPVENSFAVLCIVFFVFCVVNPAPAGTNAMVASGWTTTADPASALAALGGISADTNALHGSNNLAELGNAALARTNLGLGSAATNAASAFQAAAGALSNLVNGASNAYAGSFAGDGASVSNLSPASLAASLTAAFDHIDLPTPFFGAGSSVSISSNNTPFGWAFTAVTTSRKYGVSYHITTGSAGNFVGFSIYDSSDGTNWNILLADSGPVSTATGGVSMTAAFTNATPPTLYAGHSYLYAVTATSAAPTFWCWGGATGEGNFATAINGIYCLGYSTNASSGGQNPTNFGRLNGVTANPNFPLVRIQ